MSLKIILSYLGCCILLLFSCVSQPDTQTSFPHAFKNEKAGIAVVFPEDWTLYTSKEDAPEPFKPQFEQKQSEIDSPLFAGLNLSQQAGTLCVYEIYEASVLDYFELQKVVLGDTLTILNAYYMENLETIEWEFNITMGKMVFSYLQTFIKQEGRILKLSSWSLSALYEKYKDEFRRIHHSVGFFNPAQGEWEKTWLNLEDARPRESIVEVVVQESSTIENKKNNKYFFWRIQGDRNTVYCLGSIHVGKPDFYPLNEQIEKSFNESENLVVEVHMTPEENLKFIEEIKTRGRLPEGETLQNVLSEKTYNEVATYFEDYGLPFDNMKNMKPWIIASTIQILQLQILGYVDEYGIDNYFIKKATGVKNIISLETLEEQLILFEELDGNAYLALILLEAKTEGSREYELLIQAWKDGDSAQLEQMFFEDYLSDIIMGENLMEKLVIERNYKMTAQIRDCLKAEEDYFIVVGAGHFIGEQGIIALLEKEGYKIERM